MLRIAAVGLLLPLFFSLSGCGILHEYSASKAAENEITRGLRELDRQRPSRALFHFEKAADLRPQPDVYARIGLAFFWFGHLEAALPWLDEAKSAQPSQPWLFETARAGACAAAGRHSEARALIQRSLASLPDDPIVLNAAAYSTADAGLLLEEMIIILQRAVALAPKDGMILDSLGWAYYRKGDLEKALPLLDKAASLSDDPEIRMHLNQAVNAFEDRNYSP